VHGSLAARHHPKRSRFACYFKGSLRWNGSPLVRKLWSTSSARPIAGARSRRVRPGSYRVRTGSHGKARLLQGEAVFSQVEVRFS